MASRAIILCITQPSRFADPALSSPQPEGLRYKHIKHTNRETKDKKSGEVEKKKDCCRQLFSK